MKTSNENIDVGGEWREKGGKERERDIASSAEVGGKGNSQPKVESGKDAAKPLKCELA